MYYIPCIIEVYSVLYGMLFDYSMYYTSIFNISYWNWLLFVHVVYLLLDYLYCCVLFSLNPIVCCYCFSTLSIHICSNCASPKWHIYIRRIFSPHRLIVKTSGFDTQISCRIGWRIP